ncbi:MAG: M2 family metallopeptidase [Planctomycetes bacterium]|nr:M2 family metallopeptidase [Planctomycetota bacterium]
MMRIRKNLLRTILTLAVPLLLAERLVAGDAQDSSFRTAVTRYLSSYEARYLVHHRALEAARWRVLADGGADRSALQALNEAEFAFAAFVGSIENIELSRTYLRRVKELPEVEQRELARISYLAAGSSDIVSDLVEQRLATNAAALDALRSQNYVLLEHAVTRAEIDRILWDELDLARRRAAWESRFGAGRSLREALVRSRWLSNETVRSMGSGDYFSYRARDYGLSVQELQRQIDGILRELRPLQTQLHTFVRYELARLYEMPVPDLIPAHWLPEYDGADWSGIAPWIGFVPLAELDLALESESPRELVERADRLWVSLGFDPLPSTFYERSILGTKTGLQSTAPAVRHIDGNGDVRAFVPSTFGARGLRAALGVVGEAQCALSTVRPDVPLILRTGANRVFHAALGGAVTHAAMRSRSLRSSGLAVGAGNDDSIPRLLSEALALVMPIAYSGGTLCRFEREIYRDRIAPETWNTRWWQIAGQYQGIAPPAPRDERWCDPAAIESLFRAPAEGYDRALQEVIAFELYDHVARKLLDRDLHAADAYGRTELGEFIESIARFGATVDWRTKLRQKLGYELSTRAIVDYFAPLYDWLERRNAGRAPTLPGL